MLTLLVTRLTGEATPVAGVWGDVLLGVGCSLGAAFLVWAIWWIRVFIAAGRYCGRWGAYKLSDRTIVPMEGNGTAEIRRGGKWLSPEVLTSTAEYDGSPQEGRVKLQGSIILDPVAPSHAFVTLSRVGEKVEYGVQEYFLMPNGDIYVQPAISERIPPDYNKHVLRRV